MSFALAALLQQRAAQREPIEHSLRPSLLLALARRPLWLGGVGALVAGYGLQALALGLGPVALVQPVITVELVFAVPIAMWVGHRRPGRRDWLGICLVVGGVSLFLGVASPASGVPDPTAKTWSIVIISVAGALALIAAVAAGAGPRRRAMVLAAGAGIAFALLAVLTKATTYALSHGSSSVLSTWELYAVVVVGIVGLLYSQSAFQAGPLAHSMPVIAIIEPTVAVVIGSTVLNERIGLSGAALGVELAGAVAASVGVVLLATSKVVLSIYEKDGEDQRDEATGSPVRSGMAAERQAR